jgi:hypothetical protein
MTLILTIVNSRGVHQSSDYQLTLTTGEFVSDRLGSKQLEAQFLGFHVHLAFTGIANGRTRRTIDWLATELKALPQNSTLQAICNALAKRSTSEMKPYGKEGALTLVLSVSTVGGPFRLATISNVEDWSAPKPRAKKGFDISIRTVRKPFHLINGYRGCVPLTERHRLKALARSSPDMTAEQLCKELADINAIAAKNSKGSVSAGCWVSSQISDGNRRQFAMHNVGHHSGAVRNLQNGIDISEFIKQNFQLNPDAKLIAAAGVMAGPGDGVPLPPPEGEPRQFFLSGSSITGILRSSSGEHCATIHITQLDDDVTMQRNQTARGPFVRIQLESSGQDSLCADFPRPKFPWPQVKPPFAIDGVPVDRGLEYTVVHWVEDGVLHVEIPQCSRALRNVAFLGDDDELVIVVSDATLTWAPAEAGPSATLEAELTWRVRLDGTRG